MYTCILTITRPDTSAPFWFDSNVKPPLYDQMAQTFLDGGMVLSIDVAVSQDELVLNRTVSFNTEADFHSVVDQITQQLPTVYADRTIYNQFHNHVMITSFITS